MGEMRNKRVEVCGKLRSWELHQKVVTGRPIASWSTLLRVTMMRERERKRGELGEIFQAPAEEVVKKKIKAGH